MSTIPSDKPFDLIAHLPCEIGQQYVAPYLTLKTALDCRKVSKQWNDLFSNSRIWNTYNKHSSSTIKDNPFQAYLFDIKTKQNIDTLKFKYEEFFGHPNCTFKGMTVWKNKVVTQSNFGGTTGEYRYFVFDDEISHKYSTVNEFGEVLCPNYPLIEETTCTYLDRINPYTCFTVLDDKLIAGNADGNIYELKENETRRLIFSNKSKITQLAPFKGNIIAVTSDAKAITSQLNLINLSGKVLNAIEANPQKILTYKNLILCVEGVYLKILGENLEFSHNLLIAKENIQDALINDRYIYVAADFTLISFADIEDALNGKVGLQPFKTEPICTLFMKKLHNRVMAFKSGFYSSTTIMQLLNVENPKLDQHVVCLDTKISSETTLAKGSKIFSFYENKVRVINFENNLS
ncbi:MAG: F-box protein [Parachlamydiales bacterium]|nr:F-box protein [Parachlamydiales bacterium]